VGNPPFQNGKNNNYYVNFVKKSRENCKQNGIIAFITPNRLFTGKSKAYDQMQELTVKEMWWDVSNYEGWKIGTFVAAWIAINRKHNKEFIKIINSNLQVNNGAIICNSAVFKLNEISYSIMQKIIESPNKLEFHRWPTQHSACISRVMRRWNSITKRGGHKAFRYGENKTENVYHVKLKDKSEINNAILYITESKLARFLSYAFGGSIFVMKTVLEFLPAVDFSEKISDYEIYKFVGLNQDEIEYLEKVIK
jgi:hypothetical protein